MTDKKHVVVVGAGVSGLTSALMLSENPAYSITVVAKHMPGDYDIDYASPWAGANYLPVSKAGTAAAEHDRDTWPHLEKLAREQPACGIHFQNTVIYSQQVDDVEINSLFQFDPWWKEVVPNFKTVVSSPETKGYDYATTFTSVCINTAIYLPYLVSQCLSRGIVLKRAVLPSITAARLLHHTGNPASVIINCTGLSAGKLGEVEDPDMIPVRGQTVLVRNEVDFMSTSSRTMDGAGEEEMFYVMVRAAGGGTLLGGSYQKYNTNPLPDPNLALRIMTRAVELFPALTNGKGIEHLDIIRHGVGIRPVRKGGVRIERERLPVKEKVGETPKADAGKEQEGGEDVLVKYGEEKGTGIWVVHNYGHGGYGYQSSYGCAGRVVKLVEECFEEGKKE